MAKGINSPPGKKGGKNIGEKERELADAKKGVTDAPPVKAAPPEKKVPTQKTETIRAGRKTLHLKDAPAKKEKASASSVKREFSPSDIRAAAQTVQEEMRQAVRGAGLHASDVSREWASVRDGQMNISRNLEAYNNARTPEERQALEATLRDQLVELQGNSVDTLTDALREKHLNVPKKQYRAQPATKPAIAGLDNALDGAMAAEIAAAPLKKARLERMAEIRKRLAKLEDDSKRGSKNVKESEVLALEEELRDLESPGRTKPVKEKSPRVSSVPTGEPEAAVSEAEESSVSESEEHTPAESAEVPPIAVVPEPVDPSVEKLEEIKLDARASEPETVSPKETLEKLEALMAKYSPEAAARAYQTGYVESDPVPEDPAALQEAAARTYQTGHLESALGGKTPEEKQLEEVKERLQENAIPTPPVAPAITKADLEAEAKHREEYYKEALRASQKPRGLWQNIGALVGFAPKNYDPVGNIARLKQGAEAARAAATSGNPEGIHLAARPEASVRAPRTPEVLAAAALGTVALNQEAQLSGMPPQDQATVETLVERNAKQPKKKGLLFYGLLGGSILAAIGGIGTAVKYGLDHQGNRQPVAAGGHDVGSGAHRPSSSAARPEALQAAPGQHHDQSASTAQHEAAHAGQSEALQKAPSGISVEVNAAGEGADRLYARMREGMLNRYGITLEGAPPLIGLLTNFESPDAFSTAFGFERYPLSAVMHREGDGRTADMFVISSDGRTFTYVDSRGERHILAETSATGEVILHPLTKVPMQNYTVRRSVSHIANVAPRTIARPLTAPTPPQVAPPRAEAAAATPEASVTPPPPDVPPRPRGPVGQLLQ